MKISQNYYGHYGYEKKVKTNTTIQNNSVVEAPKQKKIMPTAMQVLSFCGGKSLNLAETIKQIEQHGEFPEDIKELAEKTIKEGNPKNKTLIDVHKEKYADLYACDNLEEVRFFFPEFKDILSDKEVIYKENSFIDAVKKGEIPYFDKDKDVTLQLLQMYWGEGISLNDFKKEFAGRNIYGVFEKLNIPRMNQLYAHYLGFSDKDKNNRFVEAMKNRLNSAEYLAKQRASRVGIESKHLTPEHKAKISESLKKYYAENPEMAYRLSEANKKYLEENPQQKEVFSQVLLRAWKYPEAKSIKKALSKHMSMPDLTNEEIIKLTNNAFNSDLKAFWDKNPWAKKNFSICMSKSWTRQKDLTSKGLIYEPLYELNLLPKFIEKEFMRKDPKTLYFTDALKKYTQATIPDIKDGICPSIASMENYAGFLLGLNEINPDMLNAYTTIRLYGLLDGLDKLKQLGNKNDKDAEELHSFVKEKLNEIFDKKDNSGSFILELDLLLAGGIAPIAISNKRRDLFEIFMKSTYEGNKQYSYDSEEANKKVKVLLKTLN